MTDKLCSLGYSNCWGNKTPEIVLKCKALGHKQHTRPIEEGLTEHVCAVCGYFYMTDPSDWGRGEIEQKTLRMAQDTVQPPLTEDVLLHPMLGPEERDVLIGEKRRFLHITLDVEKNEITCAGDEFFGVMHRASFT